MSSPVSALQGKSYSGDLSVADAGLRGMITLRGDLNDTEVQAVCLKLTGATMPGRAQISVIGDSAIGWMSPDEVLLLLPYDAVNGALEQIATALKGKHHLAVNVSDARALITVTGPCVREVIAKLAPADLHPDVFKIGDLRRTRLGQVAAAFWMTDAQSCQVICFRSVADYCYDLLVASAKAGPVGYFEDV